MARSLPLRIGMPESSTTKINVGVAGWDYRDWIGVFYPDPLPRGFDRLHFLASHVSLIEINSSFYGPPRPKTARDWLKRIEDIDEFRFTAKLWRRFTHERTTAWTRKEVRETTQGLRPLLDAHRLDAVVMQFPWSFRNTEANREWLEDVRSTFADFPLVLEVRHAGWNDPDVFQWLRDNAVGFVNIDQPTFKRSIKPSAHATSRVGYIRVHGHNYQDWFRRNAGRDRRYDYLYERDQLKPWAQRAKVLAREEETESVDVVFNNHYRAKAVVNAKQFENLLTGRKVRAPAELVSAYPAALASIARIR